MIRCPRCGAYSPDGFIGCRECFYRFDSEQPVQEKDLPLHKTSIVKNTPLDLLPFVIPKIASSPLAEEEPLKEAAGSSSEAPPPVTPVGSSSRYIQSAQNIYRAGLVLKLAIPAMLFTLGAILLWSQFGGQSYKPSKLVQKAIDNMNALAGWKADVKIESNDISSDFFANWGGEMAYSPPENFSFSARATEAARTSDYYYYAVCIVDETCYRWNKYSSKWKCMGPPKDKYKALNPMWDSTIYNKLSAKKEGQEEINGIMCQVYSFDQEVGFVLSMDIEDTRTIPGRYIGNFYIDPERELLIAIDYHVHTRVSNDNTHYRYDFHSLGESQAIKAPGYAQDLYRH
jgi:hypothetical protein